MYPPAARVIRYSARPSRTKSALPSWSADHPGYGFVLGCHAYALEEEGTGTVISLGVFADEARAGQAISIARKSGFEPQVVARLRPVDVFWLDVDRAANAGLPALEDLQGAAPRSAPPLELRPCPQSERAAATEAPTP